MQSYYAATENPDACCSNRWVTPFRRSLSRSVKSRMGRVVLYCFLSLFSVDDDVFNSCCAAMSSETMVCLLLRTNRQMIASSP